MRAREIAAHPTQHGATLSLPTAVLYRLPLGSVNGQPESLIYQTGPYKKNVHVQFDVWGLKASQPNRMGKAAAWSRAVSHRLIIRSTVHEGSIARQARYRCAAFALLQDHSASSEEQNAAIQTKKKKGKKMNNQKS